MNWTRDLAVELCKRIEGYCPRYGAHVALTGSLLYGNGEPKQDCDILFYRIRQGKIDHMALLDLLAKTEGLQETYANGWVTKFTYKNGQKLDVFWPEEREIQQGDDEDYPK